MKRIADTVKKYSLYSFFLIILFIISCTIYYIQIRLFNDVRTTEFYFLQDMAFLPLQVLLGVFIIDRIISRREKKRLMSKLNMVIGTFFSECGNGLLASFSSMTLNEIPQCGSIGSAVWKGKDYALASDAVRKAHFDLRTDGAALTGLHDFLRIRRESILRLLENPNLLEHERFTDLLWAVTHLAEELDYRDDLYKLAPPDTEHLKGDIIRAYRLLLLEWLSYMCHLQEQYPYLFSLAARKNPFSNNG